MLESLNKYRQLYIAQILTFFAYVFIAWPSEKFDTILMFQVILVSPFGVYNTRTLLDSLLLFAGPGLMLINLIWNKSFKKTVGLMRLSIILMFGELINYHISIWGTGSFRQCWYFIPEALFWILAIGMVVIFRYPNLPGRENDNVSLPPNTQV
jgi:hypothetical protein